MTSRPGMLVGVLGTALCLAALVGLWVYRPAWERKTDEIHTRVDEALEHFGTRIENVRERVRTVNTMTAELRTELKSWAETESADPEHVGHRAELISAHLHRALDGIDFGKSFLERIRAAQQLSHPLKGRTETPQLDVVLDEVGVLRERVSDAADSFEEVRQRARETDNEAELERKIATMITSITRVIAIVESADERLGQLADRVVEARERADELTADVHRWTSRGSIGTTVFLLWMAIGQIALCVLASRRAESTTP